MNNIEKCFKGISHGGRCTGTVHFFKLDVGALLKAGVIRIEQQSMIDPGGEKARATYGYDYVFGGFREFAPLPDRE